MGYAQDHIVCPVLESTAKQDRMSGTREHAQSNVVASVFTVSAWLHLNIYLFSVAVRRHDHPHNQKEKSTFPLAADGARESKVMEDEETSGLAVLGHYRHAAQSAPTPADDPSSAPDGATDETTKANPRKRVC